MEILQPLLLWGAAAISIPILIHLWHKRKGKKIQWAAMRWLMDKEDQPKKGLKPDHLLLLFLRMMIILLVVFFLSQPYLNALTDDTVKENIHLVEPNQALIDEFRFELEQALSAGEALYWLGSELKRIGSLDEITQIESGKDKALADAFSQLVQPHHVPHLYLNPYSTYMEPPFYLTPFQPVLHLGEYSPTPLPNRYMVVRDADYLFVNQQGILETSPIPPSGKQPIDHTGPITYYIDLDDQTESDNIISALQAIEEVYGIRFEESPSSENMDIYFGDNIPIDISFRQLYIISNNTEYAAQKNVKIEPEPFTKDRSDLVASGRLPEYILDKILSHLELTSDISKISRQQLEQQFIIVQQEPQDQQGNINEWIILMLLITVITERILALKRGM